jgi:hypothetical protein
MKPNSELMLMGIASAPILQNPLLAVRCSSRQSIFCCPYKKHCAKNAFKGSVIAVSPVAPIASLIPSWSY